MPSISLTNAVAGQIADAGMVNNNNAALIAAINGGLDNANISPSAAISPTKLSIPGTTSTFLRGDGTWASVGGGGGSGGGDLAWAAYTTNTILVGTSASSAQTLVTAPNFVADGSAYWLEFFCGRVQPQPQGRTINFNFWETVAGTDLGRAGAFTNTMASGVNSFIAVSIICRFRHTPASGTRTYQVKAWVGDGSAADSSGHNSEVDGSSIPGYIRIWKA